MNKNLETALKLFESIGEITLIAKNSEHIFKYSYDNFYAVQVWIKQLNVSFVKVGHLKIKVN